MTNNRPEIAFVIQNILPLFATQFDYPLPEDEKNTKIDEISVRIASNVKKPDVVYYQDGIPVFLIEAKKDGKSEADAVDQALSYIRNYPVEKYSKNSIKPRFFAVTIGKQINFYAHRFEIEQNNFKDWAEKLENPITFAELLEEYGLKKIERKEVFTPEVFRKEVLNELGPLYKFEDKITPEVVKNVAMQVLAFLQYGKDYTSHRPYIDLERNKDRQVQVRQVYEKFDWINSLGPKIAKEFRTYILRSFQGTNLNQYLTEQCVIDFMTNLVGNLKPETKVLDFECGSGGYLATVINKGVKLENIRGVDIDELPYIISKTYIAIFYKKSGIQEIETLPIVKGNGLFYQGNNWDLVIGNPAGGSKYEQEDLEKLEESLDLDLNRNGRRDSISEYNLSVQQAVNSIKVGGKFCLVLPEGFFSNSNDEYLRKFVSKYCKILAIVSLPRGVFKKGTSTKQQQKGSQSSSQKMSILYGEKQSEVDKTNPIGELGFDSLEYPVFLASVSEPESKSGNIDTWLDPKLNIVWQQWQEWKQFQKLKSIPKVEIKQVTISNKVEPPISLLDQLVKEEEVPKAVKIKSKTIISKLLEGIFK